MEEQRNIVIRNGVEIDMRKVKRMIVQIIGIERNNAKTKEANDSEMITKIQKIIEEEAKCL